MQATRSYRGPAYWEVEEPRIVESGKRQFRFYPMAGKLQVLRPYTKDGEVHFAHETTLDYEDVQSSTSVVALLAEFLGLSEEA